MLRVDFDWKECMATAEADANFVRRGSPTINYAVSYGAAPTPHVNRPGESGDSTSWEGWSHVSEFVEEVPARAA